MKRMTLRKLRMTLLEIDPKLAETEETDAYNTALLVLAAWGCGPDLAKLTRLTKLPKEFVERILWRMIAADLWTETGACCDHWWISPEVFSTSAFWADVLVAEGQVVRYWVEAEGNYRYWYQPE